MNNALQVCLLPLFLLVAAHFPITYLSRDSLTIQPILLHLIIRRCLLHVIQK
jgi:hypothetical protein